MNGRKVSKEILANLKERVSKLAVAPRLAVVIVGERKDSVLYVNMKAKACEDIGIGSEVVRLPEDVSQKKLEEVIRNLNNQVDGILLQLPLPEHLNTNSALQSIDPDLDVDGLHSQSLGDVELFGMEAKFSPCTPKGCLVLLEEYGISLQGKHCVVIGASKVVGKPLVLLLLSKNATVTVCNKQTQNIREHTTRADILFSATGCGHLVKPDWIKPGAIVVDIGTSFVPDATRKSGQRLVGDVDPLVQEKASYVTPVPGGVGPMTIAMLLQNTVDGFANKRLKKKLCSN